MILYFQKKNYLRKYVAMNMSQMQQPYPYTSIASEKN